MKELFKKYREIIVYIGVGLMATVISYGVRLALIYGGSALLHFDLSSTEAAMVAKVSVLRTSASVIGSLAAIFASFYPNKIWVFQDYEKDRKKVWGQFGAFFGSRVISMLIEAGIAAGMPLLLTACGYKTFKFILTFDADLMTTAFSVVFITVLNYVVSKLLVFRKKKKKNS